ncbi:CAP domain-containing protein [Prosthecochloris sp. GSB1]|uniref:CAP domain-containing protein n=1 Tax=Prosthecochloris sp. GSB1 TaxID=281093 RepID=UPI00142DA306|nr:CAP domain-containing protein [Prosthecochloris sp. GSB1]
MRLAAVSLLLCGASSLHPSERAAASTVRHEWSIEAMRASAGANYLDSVEKEVLLHLNMARTDPGKYAKEYIAPRIRHFDGRLYRDPSGAYLTREGLPAVRECVSAMQRARPAGALTPSETVTIAAEEHARDQSRTGMTGHRRADGSKPGASLRKFGRWRITGENIAYGLNSGREIVANLLVDDGVRDRGHRKNILDPQFSIVGLAIEPHPVHRYVCVIDFVGG